MKITKSRARSSKQLKFKTNNFTTSKQGLTSSLLEKYKPKNLYTAKDISGRFGKESCIRS